MIVLTKADLCPELPQRLAEIASVSVGTEVIVCSCVEENGWQNVRSRIGTGRRLRSSALPVSASLRSLTC